jgi:hypothetical protein
MHVICPDCATELVIPSESGVRPSIISHQDESNPKPEVLRERSKRTADEGPAFLEFTTVIPDVLARHYAYESFSSTANEILSILASSNDPVVRVERIQEVKSQQRHGGFSASVPGVWTF